MKADKPKFKVGEIVYHLADGSRGVVSHILYGEDSMAYRVVTGVASAATCEACELTADYDDVKALIED